MQKYKPKATTSLFEKEDNQQKTSKTGNSLKMLNKVVDFELFDVQNNSTATLF